MIRLLEINTFAKIKRDFRSRVIVYHNYNSKTTIAHARYISTVGMLTTIYDENNFETLEQSHRSNASNEWKTGLCWAYHGGVERVVVIEQLARFFAHSLPWAMLFWVFFREHIFCKKETYLLAGDEVVVSKAGKKSYGIDRFFSSLYDKPILGLSFFTLSLVSIEQRKAFPISIEQVIKQKVERPKILKEKQSTNYMWAFRFYLIK